MIGAEHRWKIRSPKHEAAATKTKCKGPMVPSSESRTGFFDTLFHRQGGIRRCCQLDGGIQLYRFRRRYSQLDLVGCRSHPDETMRSGRSKPRCRPPGSHCHRDCELKDEMQLNFTNPSTTGSAGGGHHRSRSRGQLFERCSGHYDRHHTPTAIPGQ